MTPPNADAPEQRARQKIAAALVGSGWIVQDRDEMNVSAGRGIAVREFKLTSGHGYADYLLFVDGKAVGVLEAKPEGFTLPPKGRRMCVDRNDCKPGEECCGEGSSPSFYCATSCL